MGIEKEIHTVGYEGLHIDDFVLKIKNHGISQLIDVREIPLSRKKGFSKTALHERLKLEGIDYIHVRDLGSPKRLRESLKQSWDYVSFFNEFTEHLEGRLHVLDGMLPAIYRNNSCLMCFEESADKCHRSVVADMLIRQSGNELGVVNI